MEYFENKENDLNTPNTPSNSVLGKRTAGTAGLTEVREGLSDSFNAEGTTVGTSSSAALNSVYQVVPNVNNYYMSPSSSSASSSSSSIGSPNSAVSTMWEFPLPESRIGSPDVDNNNGDEWSVGDFYISYNLAAAFKSPLVNASSNTNGPAVSLENLESREIAVDLNQENLRIDGSLFIAGSDVVYEWLVGDNLLVELGMGPYQDSSSL